MCTRQEANLATLLSPKTLPLGK